MLYSFQVTVHVERLWRQRLPPGEGQQREHHHNDPDQHPGGQLWRQPEQNRHPANPGPLSSAKVLAFAGIAGPLGRGERVAKHDLRVEAYGTVDEANSAIGLARAARRIGRAQERHRGQRQRWFAVRFTEGEARPLLDLTRDAVLAYCAERGIPFRTDATNADVDFTRAASLSRGRWSTCRSATA